MRTAYGREQMTRRRRRLEPLDPEGEGGGVQIAIEESRKPSALSTPGTRCRSRERRSPGDASTTGSNATEARGSKDATRLSSSRESSALSNDSESRESRVPRAFWIFQSLSEHRRISSLRWRATRTAIARGVSLGKMRRPGFEPEPEGPARAFGPARAATGRIQIPDELHLRLTDCSPQNAPTGI